MSAPLKLPAIDSAADPPSALPPLLLTAADLADLLRVSVATIWRLRAAGKLPRPTAALGRQLVRWEAEEVRRWVAAGMPPAAEWEALRDAAQRNGRPR